MTETSGTPERRNDSGRFAATRRRAEAASTRVLGWFETRRAERVPYDLAARFYERDRESFASVLGAAIALRLFLFVVAIALLVAGVLVLIGGDAVGSALSGANVTGSMASQISDAAVRGRSTGVVVFLSGLWLTFTNGRKLTAVLSACSASSWHLEARQARSTVRMAGSVTGLVIVLLFAAAVLNRIHQRMGLGVEAVSWVVAATVFGVGWFAVCWTLPRATRDPGALLPGAALVGLTMGLLQWFMQLYLPARIARSSEVMGSLGFTVAALGYMFVIGRLMAASLILNAVVWERLGSVSSLVFALPVLRRIPERSPRVARFFDLDRDGEPRR